MRRLGKTILLTCLLCMALCMSAQAMTNDMLKVGIKYGSEAMSEANLQNYSSFSGYAFGYFDSDRSFVELGRVGNEYEKITVMTETSYAVEFDESFSSFEEAQATASAYDGYVAYTLDGYRVRVGTFSDRSAAQSAEANFAEATRVAGNTGTGVKVFVTGSNTVLFGFDCSGLVYYVYKQFGITLARTAAEQAKNGVPVEPADLRPGDILCFSSGYNYIGHAGIYIGKGQFVHAATSKTGVIVTDLSGYYSEKGYVARRIIT